ncbi:putative transposase [Georgenia muralis]|uniref:Putative transposase n=2 Tax=Georgenia muralis TaxID=154117 RepID=A0A3N4Z6Z9_9MICO|nr:putative transposase [Georgenia muralis]
MTTTQWTSQDLMDAAVRAAETEDVPTDDPQPSRPEKSARQLREELVSDDLIERLVKQAGAEGVALTGQGGFLPELIRSVLERGLAAELDDHLGYAKGERAGRGNSRNGSTPKTVETEIGPVPLATPRDRDGSFNPRLVPKGQRRLGGLDEMIISLYAGGMTVRDIQAHLARTLGTDLSHETIANITDAVTEEVIAWQSRPLDPVYPVVFLDALVVKVRHDAHVVNRAAHIAVGIDTDGIKHVLGIWVQSGEGAKFWAGVCAQLANRGVKDILIACCDGLPGLPEAIEATWPNTIVQTCVVHLIRAANRYLAYGDRKAFSAGLRRVYTAPDADAAETALLELAETDLGRKYPAAIAVWQRAWERFTPFLAFPPEVRRVIYTTNTIESLNYQLRKIIKNRGHFPSDDAVIKLLWLAITDIEDKRARQRAKEAGLPANRRKAAGRLVEGATTEGWNAALNQLELLYPDRLAGHINQ